MGLITLPPSPLFLSLSLPLYLSLSLFLFSASPTSSWLDFTVLGVMRNIFGIQPHSIVVGVVCLALTSLCQFISPAIIDLADMLSSVWQRETERGTGQ